MATITKWTKFAGMLLIPTFNAVASPLPPPGILSDRLHPFNRRQ